MSGAGRLDHVRRTALGVLWFASVTLVTVEVGGEPGLSPLAPTATPLLGNEATDDESELAPLAAVTPLRLTLVFDVFPQARFFPGCESREEPSGNTKNGFPVQRYTFLPLAPRLVLHGFSSSGCPVDAGAGAGLTYAMPLVTELWLVPSAGFYALTRPGMPAITTTAARVDLVKSTGDGTQLNVGLGIKYGTSDLSNALAFGGRF